MSWMLRPGRIRRRQQTAFYSGVAELLAQLERSLLKRSGIEEFVHCVGSVLVADVLVVGSVGQQQLLVIAQEWRRIREALVPQQHQPAAGFQDANELPARPFAVEPVCGLRRGDEVHAMIR